MRATIPFKKRIHYRGHFIHLCFDSHRQKWRFDTTRTSHVRFTGHQDSLEEAEAEAKLLHDMADGLYWNG